MPKDPQYLERTQKSIRDIMNLREDEVLPDTLLTELGDSIDAIDMLVELEDEFNLCITDESWEKCKTVLELADEMERLVNEKAAD